MAEGAFMGSPLLKAEAYAIGLIYGKAGGKCVHLGLHIKQEADGPEESCPVILRAGCKPKE